MCKLLRLVQEPGTLRARKCDSLTKRELEQEKEVQDLAPEVTAAFIFL